MRSRLSAHERYTKGDCWYLALILHRLYGYKLCTFSIYHQMRGETVYYHAFVLLDEVDGKRRYLDIDGISDFDQIRGRYIPPKVPSCLRGVITEHEISDFTRWKTPLLRLRFPDNHLYVYRVARRLVKKFVEGMEK